MAERPQAWRKPAFRPLRKILLILLAGLVVWWLVSTETGRKALDWLQTRAGVAPLPGDTGTAPSPRKERLPTPGRPAAASPGDKWVDAQGNDGDSFRLTHDGKITEYRLYFVDAPESRRHKYNSKRISEQAAYFGISDDQSIEIGKEAKEFTAETLRSLPFRIHTTGERVYDSERIYAMIELEPDTPKARWLCEELTARGLVRIHTQGTKLSDGTSQAKFTARLRGLERTAKIQKKGAWQFSR